MATEDFTTYSEVDPNAHIGVTADVTTSEYILRNETAYLYKDKGVAYYDGDYEFLFDFVCNAANGDNGGIMYMAMLANVLNDGVSIDSASGDFLAARNTYGVTSTNLQIWECDGGTAYADTYTSTVGTRYYGRLTRDETVGSYGTLYFYIYDDDARTNLVDTLSLSLHSSKKDFRYVFPVNSYNSGHNLRYDGDIRYLDIGESGGGTSGSPWHYYAQQ